MVCPTFLCKLRGLMCVRWTGGGAAAGGAQRGEARPAIHVLFMAMDIAVVWISASGVVVDVRRAKRWQLLLVPKAPACYVLEAHVSRLLNFAVGDQLIFEPEPT